MPISFDSLAAPPPSLFFLLASFVTIEKKREQKIKLQCRNKSYSCVCVGEPKEKRGGIQHTYTQIDRLGAIKVIGWGYTQQKKKKKKWSIFQV